MATVILTKMVIKTLSDQPPNHTLNEFFICDVGVKRTEYDTNLTIHHSSLRKKMTIKSASSPWNHSLQIFYSVLTIILCGTAQASGSEGSGQQLQGVVLPVNQSKLGFTQSGVVVKLPLEGDQIKKGAVLARIDRSEARLKVAKARANLEKAKLALKHAKREEEKTDTLIKNGIISITAAEESEDIVQQAKIEVKLAEVEVATAKLALQGCKLSAPFDGVVVTVTANVGEWLEAGAAALELVDLTQLEISMDASLTLVNDLRIGMQADVISDGVNVGKAEVRVILPLIDAASSLRRVIWNIHPKKDVVVAGRYVTLTPSDAGTQENP
jgi:RND family efflux transporter MFP subunit